MSAVDKILAAEQPPSERLAELLVLLIESALFAGGLLILAAMCVAAFHVVRFALRVWFGGNS